MKEVEVEVKTFLKLAKCDCGGTFERDYTRPILTSYPEQYPHKCNKCGEIFISTNSYPQTIYKYGTENEEPMDDMVTIKLNPLALKDLLDGCEYIIKGYKADVEYYTMHCNPKPEYYSEKIDSATRQLNVMLETKEAIQKAYDEYLSLDTKSEGAVCES